VARLSGKVAIVTGAGRGIGREIAILFAREGAAVALVSRTAASVDEAIAEIQSSGGVAAGFVCDISQPDEVAAAVTSVMSAFGGVDILVNNAHDTRNVNARVAELTTAHLRTQMSGTDAALQFMQLCRPSMVQRGGGNIINMASAAGVHGSKTFAPYAMAKEAVRALTRCAAREWGSDGITVNAICPLATTDALQQAIDTGVAQAPSGPLGRYGSPADDIAPVALFLASADSRFITGHTLMADGGLSMDAGR